MDQFFGLKKKKYRKIGLSFATLQEFQKSLKVIVSNFQNVDILYYFKNFFFTNITQGERFCNDRF